MRRLQRRTLLRTAPLAVVGAVLLIALGRPVSWRATSARSIPADLSEACETENPYLVTTCFHEPSIPVPAADLTAAIVVFRDTPGDTPHYALATFGEVGSVYGLAYNPREPAVYAAAFNKRQQPFGEGGPGAIYRIDMTSGDVQLWAVTPGSGSDRHGPRGTLDRVAGQWAGKLGLGDIELSEDGRELFVVNLFDRTIYRFAVPSGQLIGSFAHGAAAEAWSEEARPFGLAVRGERLFHGVVRSAELSLDRADLEGLVYSSLADGSDTRLETRFAIDYARGFLGTSATGLGRPIPLDWLPWTDDPSNIADRGGLAPGATMHPMPMLVDLAFVDPDHMVVGLRDRLADVAALFSKLQSDYAGLGIGDILHGVPADRGWLVEPLPEHFDDDIVASDESSMGALAAIDWAGTVATNGWAGIDEHDPYATILDTSTVFWYDTISGGKVRHEGVCRSTGPQPLSALFAVPALLAHDEGPRGGLSGDLEVLCPGRLVPSATPPSSPTATPTATSTSTPPPTRTATVTPEAERSPTPSPVVVPTPAPIHLPLLLTERCDPERQRADVVMIVDTSSSMAGGKLEDAKEAALAFVALMDLAPGRDQVGIVRFDAEAEVVQELTSSRAGVEMAIRRFSSREGTHIDKGLRLARDELASERRNDANMAVAVLLTDGMQTGESGAEIVAAREVRDAGIRLYTIGLGDDVDEVTLVEMAGRRDRYRFAPDSAELKRIYSEIARDIMCPAEEFWGKR